MSSLASPASPGPFALPVWLPPFYTTIGVSQLALMGITKTQPFVPAPFAYTPAPHAHTTPPTVQPVLPITFTSTPTNACPIAHFPTSPTSNTKSASTAQSLVFHAPRPLAPNARIPTLYITRLVYCLVLARNMPQSCLMAQENAGPVLRSARPALINPSADHARLGTFGNKVRLKGHVFKFAHQAVPS